MMAAPIVELQVVMMLGVEIALDPRRLDRIAEFVLTAEGRSGQWEVALVLTTDSHLRELHRDYMGIDSETDVMTFPTDSPPGEERYGGDIVVSVDRVHDQAPMYDHSSEQEIEFLAVHGLLHLCGWDDTDPDDRARMLGRQTALIQEFNQAEMDRSKRDGERRRQ